MSGLISWNTRNMNTSRKGKLNSWVKYYFQIKAVKLTQVHWKLFLFHNMLLIRRPYRDMEIKTNTSGAYLSFRCAPEMFLIEMFQLKDVSIRPWGSHTQKNQKTIIWGPDVFRCRPREHQRASVEHSWVCSGCHTPEHRYRSSRPVVLVVAWSCDARIYDTTIQHRHGLRPRSLSSFSFLPITFLTPRLPIRYGGWREVSVAVRPGRCRQR